MMFPAAATVPTVRLCDIPISRLGFAETAVLIASWLEEDTPRRVATANLDFLRVAASNATARDLLRGADLVTADGMPLLWLAHTQGMPLCERVTGADLVPTLLAHCASQGHGVFFLGGADHTAAEAAQQAMARHPGLRIAGVANPMVELDDRAACDALATAIRATGAGLLLVGFGNPKQEAFLERHLAATGARVGMGVGGTFDFLSGRRRRAPGVLQRVGLEWVFRMAQDPRHLARRYARGLAFFPLAICAARKARKVSGGSLA